MLAIVRRAVFLLSAALLLIAVVVGATIACAPVPSPTPGPNAAPYVAARTEIRTALDAYGAANDDAGRRRAVMQAGKLASRHLAAAPSTQTDRFNEWWDIAMAELVIAGERARARQYDLMDVWLARATDALTEVDSLLPYAFPSPFDRADR